MRTETENAHKSKSNVRMTFKYLIADRHVCRFDINTHKANMREISVQIIVSRARRREFVRPYKHVYTHERSNCVFTTRNIN